jgi:head-tail adaptor
VIDVGQRDKLVTIQERTDVTDGSGFPTVEWSLLGTAHMHRRDMNGRERFANAQVAAVGDREWVMAYQANMDPDVYDVPKERRLVFTGWAFDIVHARIDDETAPKAIVLTTSGRKAPAQP